MRVPSTLCAVLVALAAWPGVALADECEDDFLECKDTCLIQYGGSIRVEQKKKYDKCLKKCTKSSRRCTEREVEASTNNLDEGALKNTPTSDQVDSSGMPESKKKKKAASAEPDDDAATSDEPAPKKDPLREDEVPKSSRTSLKVEEPKSPPPETKKADEPRAEAKPAEPDVIRMTPKKDDGKSTGDDLRDDGPRPEDKPAAEEPPKKKREKPKEPPPKKEEDHDDLRNY